MKALTASLVALTLAAGAASAAQFPGTSRNASVEPQPSSAQQVEVKAGTVLTTSELKRAKLKANDLISVTSFPSAVNAQASYER